jgi:hypothetical protein
VMSDEPVKSEVIYIINVYLYIIYRSEFVCHLTNKFFYFRKIEGRREGL